MPSTVAPMPNPVEGNPPFWKHLRKFESQDSSKKGHGALQVSDCQMTFEEIASRNHVGLHIS